MYGLLLSHVRIEKPLLVPQWGLIILNGPSYQASYYIATGRKGLTAHCCVLRHSSESSDRPAVLNSIG